MDQEEKLQILRSARLLEEYENTPRTFNDPYAEMSDIEKSKLIIYLQELLEEQKRQVREQREIASRERARADQLMSKLDERMAQAMARSQAGSDILRPPAIFKNTSLAER